MFWGISSIGRVRALQARGTGIETPMLQLTFNFYILGGVCIYFRRSCEIFSIYLGYVLMGFHASQ